MKSKLIKLIPYIIVLAADFWLMPFLSSNTGSAILIMLCVMPIIAFIAGTAYGIRNGFSLFLPIASVILFLPTIFIHYNSSAWIYSIVYAVIVLAGNGFGRLFYQKR